MSISVPDLKMDRRRGNIVVSRRTVLEETRAEQRQELVQNLERVRSSTAWSRTSPTTVRSWTSAASTASCMSTDIAWRRVNHPTEVLNIGQQVKVKIIKNQPRDPPHLARHEAAA